MNLKKVLIATIIPFTACALACSNNGELKGDHVYKNDFENIDGWFQNNQLVKGNAHSGKVCSRITPDNPYSLTFNKKLEELSLTNIVKVKVSAWVKFDDLKSNAKLVVTIDSAESSPPIFWYGIAAEDVITDPNKWFLVSDIVTLPTPSIKSYRLLIYVWNNGKTPVWVDDIAFQLIGEN